MSVVLSDEQQRGFDVVERFLRAREVPRPYICISGLAGVGKSVLLTAIAKRFPNAALCAPFGKAAYNLSKRTGLQAKTVHSVIYRYCGNDDDAQPIFSQKIEDDEWRGRIVLLDERSTAGSRIGADLVATGARIVAAGDDGQLDPVRDVLYFYPDQPWDIRLETVHRQAWDSPIIRQAHGVRNYGQYESDGDAFQVRGQCTRDDVMNADIIIAWRNTTRRQLNHLKRAYMGRAGVPPKAGEPIICLKNNHKAGVLNGGIYTLLRDHEINSGKIYLVNDRGEEIMLRQAWIEDFDRPLIEDEDCPNPQPFALGYCVTCHKSQGSEWPYVLLVDEYDRNRADYAKWAYTAITRASERVLVKI